jgi:hypothetical protein|tara:strand:- start:315 stop:431 length:117 start_codon:yes stop_codon:yes gene_type:complete
MSFNLNSNYEISKKKVGYVTRKDRTHTVYGEAANNTGF